jgi:DNA-directed RNA polymerase subunit RPC12/RpoP
LWDELPSIFGWLRGQVQSNVLPTLPLGVGETLIRERLVRLPSGFADQSYIETIRFAASNRLVVDLDYRDKQGRRSTRTIEAYSLRRTQADEILLMAVREDNGQSRSYLFNGILGVSVTQRTFSPRYPIDLNANVSQSIPHISKTTSTSSTYRQPLRRSSTVSLVRGGPTYVYRCSVCHKEFDRKTQDGKLRAHKNKSGAECYGRYGTYVRTKH